MKRTSNLRSKTGLAIASLLVLLLVVVQPPEPTSPNGGVGGVPSEAIGPDIALAAPAQAQSGRPYLYLPYDIGAELFAGSPHGHSGYSGVKNAIDFGVRGRADNVRAAAAGTISKTAHGGCEVWIDHGSGWTTSYNHLKGTVVSTGDRVAAGQKIGLTDHPKNNKPCGRGNFEHVHLALWHQGKAVSLDGVEIGGYRIRANSGYYCGYWEHARTAKRIGANQCLAGTKLPNTLVTPDSTQPPPPPTRFSNDARSTLTANNRTAKLDVCASGLNGQQINVIFSSGERQTKTGTAAKCLTFTSTKSFGTATFARSRAQLNTTPSAANLDACAAATNFAALCDRVALAPADKLPVGTFEGVQDKFGEVGVRGWAFDPDTPDRALAIDIYIGGQSSTPAADRHRISADQPRPDVQREHAAAGPNHGFARNIPTTKRGRQQICAYALGDTAGGNTFLGCNFVRISSPDPIGLVGIVSGGQGNVRVEGWTYDPNNPSTGIDAHVYVGGERNTPGVELHVLKANQPHDGFSTLFPEAGPNHRFAGTLATAKRGSQPICVYGINVGSGDNVLLGCKTTTISNTQVNNPSPAVLCGGKVATIVGTAGNDELRGTDGPDVIAGLQGNDTILGLGGDDLICGGQGDDRLVGGQGFDIIFGAQGSDRLIAADAEESGTADTRGARMFGGAGDDAIFGSTKWDRMQGGPGKDSLYGYEGRDWIRGGSGDDEIYGMAGIDNIHGGNGNDTMFVQGADIIKGGAGKQDRCLPIGNTRIPAATRSCERRT